MKVNLGLSSQSADDWDRVLAGDFSRPPSIPDWEWVENTLAMGDLAEPLGFDENRVEAELARADRGDIAAGTAADDENLAAKLVHVTPR